MVIGRVRALRRMVSLKSALDTTRRATSEARTVHCSSMVPSRDGARSLSTPIRSTPSTSGSHITSSDPEVS